MHVEARALSHKHIHKQKKQQQPLSLKYRTNPIITMLITVSLCSSLLIIWIVIASWIFSGGKEPIVTWGEGCLYFKANWPEQQPPPPTLPRPSPHLSCFLFPLNPLAAWAESEKKTPVTMAVISCSPEWRRDVRSVFTESSSSLDDHSKHFTVQVITIHPFTHPFIQCIYGLHFLLKYKIHTTHSTVRHI